MFVRILSNLLVKIVLLNLLFCNESPANQITLPTVPCPEIFKYEFNGYKYSGIITLRDLNFGHTEIEVKMEYPGSGKNEELPGILLLDTKYNEISDNINSGRPVVFRVEFLDQNAIPQLIDITVNDFKICSTSNENFHSIESPRSSQTFKRALIVNKKPSGTLQLSPTITNIPRTDLARSVKNPVPVPVPVRNTVDSETKSSLDIKKLPGGFSSLGGFGSLFSSMWMPMTPTNPPPQPERTSTYEQYNYSPQNRNQLLALDSICGRENKFDVRSLIANGQPVSRSRFPWLVAIQKLTDEDIVFQCAGSLISQKTVISAAHCFKEGTEAIEKSHILISLGVHNRSDQHNVVNVGVERLIIHNDFRKVPDVLDADIAIVILMQRIRFTMRVSPICLWQGPESDAVVAGAKGSIVGWGEGAPRRGLSQIPKVVTTTIVSELECIRSNNQLFYLTSNRTLCAGNKDGSGPCKGDSGGGLMMLTGERWMLRAIVSSALSTAANECDLNEYVIFTDIAKFKVWIQENIVM